ncbi:MAG: M48 family metallopeptidase [Bacteroidota bacterium]
MTDALYPPSPALADTSFLEPSAGFKSKTYRMIFGIVLFILLYLALIAFSVGLLIACTLLAIGLVSMRVSWLTIVLGLGLFALGVMFFFFTIKFIFATSKENERLEIEIDENDHPVLFEFIRKLSNEVGTKFPRRIFLVPEVNAFVSYNSSFWSMFLPVRKNLRIGLGLVNTLNISEFKATIAHEFGHFSQRSMKTGSYVYTMNKIIYNLAYQRDDWDELLVSWANTGGTFSIFAAITGAFVNGVRSMLRASYSKLNVTYLALSREMEYHADLVACSVAGNEAMVNTLRKIEFGDTAYNEAINGVNMMATKDKKKVADIYTFHSKTLAQLKSSDKSSGGPKSRLVVKDQWASHPSREDREASIGRFSIQSPMIDQSAWTLFTNPEQTRIEMTKQLYVDSPALKTLTNMDDAEMDEFVKKDVLRDTVPPTFAGIYDGRVISKFDPEKLTKSSTHKFDELINTQNADKIQGYHRDLADLRQLLSIAKGQVRVDLFEFDNVKYKAKSAQSVLDNLKDETEQAAKDIHELDENIYAYYRQRASEVGQENELIGLYKTLHAKSTDQDIALDFAGRYHTMSFELTVSREWTAEQVANVCQQIQQLEKQVKNFMRDFPEPAINNHFSEPASVIKYLKTDRLWNESGQTFNELGFGILHQYIMSSMNVANDAMWRGQQGDL